MKVEEMTFSQFQQEIAGGLDLLSKGLWSPYYTISKPLRPFHMDGLGCPRDELHFFVDWCSLDRRDPKMATGNGMVAKAEWMYLDAEHKADLLDARVRQVLGDMWENTDAPRFEFR